MKNVLVALVSLFILSKTFAQDNPRPTRSRFYNAKESTFKVKPGDLLVYKILQNGEQYDCVVTVKKFGSATSFDYRLPQKGKKATINITADEVAGSSTYTNYLANAANSSRNKNFFWLSKRNYDDLVTEGETTMDFGDGPEKFTKGNTGVLKINYKGKEKILTVYNVSSAEGDKKHLLILNEATNPLVIMMEAGWKMTLKEVR